MDRYTILTYIFGEYEKLREPKVVSENCDYVCVTDNHGLSSDVWRMVYVDGIVPEYKDQWAKSHWAKNAFFDYANTDIVIRIDGSIEILDNCDKLVTEFADSGCDLGLMPHPVRYDAVSEMDVWINSRGLSRDCRYYFERDSKFVGIDPCSEGLLESGFLICRKGIQTERVFGDTLMSWSEAYKTCGCRVEQVWLTLNVKRRMSRMRLMFYHMRQPINSRYFQICRHNSDVAQVSAYWGEGPTEYRFGDKTFRTRLVDERDNPIEIVKDFVTHDDKKSYCVLGVLKTEEGLRIEKEMAERLSERYDIIKVRQNPPGIEFEYPAMRYAFDFAKENGCDVLYVHTKGAANPGKPWQRKVRVMWMDEFVGHYDDYMRLLKKNNGKPTFITPLLGKRKETLFNGLFINCELAKAFELRHSDDRFYYETCFRGTSYNGIGRLMENVGSYEELSYVEEHYE